MKKLISALFIATLMLVASCSKNEGVKFFSQEQIMGTWTQTGGDDFIACPDGENYTIVINEEDFIEYPVNDEGCISSTTLSLPYTFDGKYMTISGGLFTIVVNDVSETGINISVSNLISSKAVNKVFIKVE